MRISPHYRLYEGTPDHRRLEEFPRTVVLGEIVAQHLEHRLGLRVKRQLNLGGTCWPIRALVRGDIDLYPEFTGTALSPFSSCRRPINPAEALALIRNEYQSRFSLQWMDPLGFNDTFAMVIGGREARRARLPR